MNKTNLMIKVTLDSPTGNMRSYILYWIILFDSHVYHNYEHASKQLENLQ